MRRVRNIQPVGADATGHLCAAFDQMPGDGRTGKPIELTRVPAEVVHTRRDGHARIGNPTGNDEIGTRRERLDYRLRTEVCVGRRESIGHFFSR